MKKIPGLLCLSLLLLFAAGCGRNNVPGDEYEPDITEPAVAETPLPTPPQPPSAPPEEPPAPVFTPVRDLMAAVAPPMPFNPPQSGRGFLDRAGIAMQPRVTAATAVPLDAAAFPLVFEAEYATLAGGARVEASSAGFTGSGYVTGITGRGNYVEFSVHVPAAGHYDLTFIVAGAHNFMTEHIYVNGVRHGWIDIFARTFHGVPYRRVFLEAGYNTVAYKANWGWSRIDRLEITPSPVLDETMFAVPPTLVNPNATQAAVDLMQFLTDIYGRYMLTGQQVHHAGGGMLCAEFEAIRAFTGQTPAVIGLDAGTMANWVDYALAFHEIGGIVTVCWHWLAPERNRTGTWYHSFWTRHTDFNLRAALAGEDPYGMQFLLDGIDEIAAGMRVLYENGVPVLWRPLHEAAGGWFWWGASGADAHIELWQLMYYRMTRYHGLNNLIWLWNGQHPDWWPGDAYADMIGYDPYPGPGVHSALSDLFLRQKDYTPAPRIVVMSENGSIPNPDYMVREGAMWSFFVTWDGSFVLEERNPPTLSDEWTAREMLLHIYNHGRTLTLEDIQRRFREGDDIGIPGMFPRTLAYGINRYTWNNFSDPAIILAEALVVEFNGELTLPDIRFASNWPGNWTEFSYDDPRVSVEPGRLILDMRGLNNYNVNFAIWNQEDYAKITRLYLTGAT